MATAPSDWRIILVGHSFIKRLHRFSQGEGDCHTPFSLSHVGTVGWKFKGGATLIDISSRPWVEEIRRFRPHAIYLESGTNDLHSTSPLVLASEVDSWIDNFRCPTLVGQVLHREGLDMDDLFNVHVDLFNSILKTILEARQDGSKLWEHPGPGFFVCFLAVSTPEVS